MTDTFDRTQLDGKDRGQLSEIAAALGVKSVSRMRKAELVDAIVSAAKGSGAESGNGSESARPRKIRSTASGGDDLAALAAEEDSLATTEAPAGDMVIRRRGPAAETTAAPAPTASADTEARTTDDSSGDDTSDGG